MQLPLLKGHFEARDARELLTQLIQVKIRFHENKIDADSPEEQIKMREARIKELQNELLAAQQFIDSKSGMISLQGEVEIL
jgi:hypothetical protein